jgi:endonuclease/exonuclease/phosphatase family metal-dependent hydrolase
VDTFRVLHPDAKEVGTLNGFRGLTNGKKIDYIFVEPDTQVLDAAIIRTGRQGRYPSDHYPVTATLRFDSGRDPSRANSEYHADKG